MKVIFGEAASNDLTNAFEWYEAQQTGLGRRFAQSLDLTKKRLILFPEVSTEIAKGIRRALIKGFPYGIIYSTKGDIIEIIAVAHLHREPMFWHDRKNN